MAYSNATPWGMRNKKRAPPSRKSRKGMREGGALFCLYKGATRHHAAAAGQRLGSAAPVRAVRGGSPLVLLTDKVARLLWDADVSTIAMAIMEMCHDVGLIGNLNTDLSLTSIRTSAVADSTPWRPLSRMVEIDLTWSHKAALCLVKPPSPSSRNTWNGLDLSVPVMGTIIANPLAPALSLSSDTTTAVLISSSDTTTAGREV